MTHITAEQVTLCLIILLPILPAYLLFKALPSSQANVTGPLQGLGLKLTGAFAGYFAVLLLILFTRPDRPPAPESQVWEIDGSLSDDQGHPLQQIDPNDVTLSPPSFVAGPGGTFRLTFTTVATPAGSGAVYPVLTIKHSKFETMTIPLDPAALKKLHPQLPMELNETERSIHLDQVALKSEGLPTYSSNGQLPPKVSASTEPQPSNAIGQETNNQEPKP